MNRDEIRTLVLETLGNIAPEADLTGIRSDADLRDELDIDSMDFLNIIIALHERLGIDIPEIDYPRLATLDGAVGYLAARMPA